MPAFNAAGPLAQILLTTAIQTAYTVPANKMAVITGINVANANAGADSIEHWIDGTGDVNLQQPWKEVAGGDRYRESLNIPLAAGSTFRAVAQNNNRLALTIHGAVWDV